MPTTTPNFGWSVPVSTDLVKDGATAIELLGDSIDTSLVDLKGGTTGQVLAKASGTDMDFSWVAVDPLTILDAKGDLISATAADTPARLAVGTNGQVLTADSTESTGIKWATPAAGGKVLQVVTATTRTTTTIATTTFTDTGLTASITPTSDTSKVMVLVTQAFELYRAGSTVQAGSILKRGSTTVWDGDEINKYSLPGLFTNASMSALQWSGQVVVSYLDSPATTASTTYKMQMALASTGASDNLATNKNVTSTITLLEIGA
jgi:hypothetical protein